MHRSFWLGNLTHQLSWGHSPQSGTTSQLPVSPDIPASFAPNDGSGSAGCKSCWESWADSSQGCFWWGSQHILDGYTCFCQREKKARWRIWKTNKTGTEKQTKCGPKYFANFHLRVRSSVIYVCKSPTRKHCWGPIRGANFMDVGEWKYWRRGWLRSYMYRIHYYFIDTL